MLSYHHSIQYYHKSRPIIPFNITTTFLCFLFRHWCCVYYCRIVSIVFGAFPYHSLFSAVTQFGLMEPTIEMQLSGYHGCWDHHNGSSR